MFQHREGIFPGVGGLELYYQNWYPQRSLQAILVIVHGLGGHSGMFEKVVRDLTLRGYTIYGFDLRGHGKSPGQRGHLNSWDEFRGDLKRFLQLIERQAPQIPRFLLGHSLGAAIALDYALRFPEALQGVIVAALPLGKVGVPRIRIAIGQIFSRVWPSFALDTGIDPAAGSRDSTVIAAYAQDPLRHTKGTARLATEFLKTAASLQTHAAELRLPLLMLHGGADRVCLPEVSRLFFEQVIFPDKEWHEYAGCYHDIHDDISYPEMLADLEHWLVRHLEKPCLSSVGGSREKTNDQGN